MNQQEILDKMTGGLWQRVDILNVNGCNIGDVKPYDEEACLLSVNAPFGAGILPEEVEEMRAILESILDGIRYSDLNEAKDLFTRINSRKCK